MARLRCHGEEVERMVKDGFNYVFMSDGKILKGGSGRYKLVNLKEGITPDEFKARLVTAGYTQQEGRQRGR